MGKCLLKCANKPSIFNTSPLTSECLKKIVNVMFTEKTMLNILSPVFIKIMNTKGLRRALKVLL